LTTASASLAHLLRRSGFGATAAEMTAAEQAGYAATAERLLAGLGAPDHGAAAIATPTFAPLPTDLGQLRSDPSARKSFTQQLALEHRQLVAWWLARMVATTNPLAEKLTFLLHGHFPTAISKVRFPQFMYGQNELFRTQGAGAFDALTQAVAVDPAMLIWLDASSDKASDPNENFARELMERFTMGIGTYTEDDVRAASYAFTGWRLDRLTGEFTIDQQEHSPAPQTFLGVPGVSTGQQVIDIVTHSGASARFVPAAFWSHLATPVTVDDPVVDDLTAAYHPDLDVTSLLRAIFSHPDFTSPGVTGGLVKQPVEYVVGALRAFGVDGTALASRPDGVLEVLTGLGQLLFDPPSVGGWGQNEYWLSTAAALTRWQFAGRLTTLVDLSPVADAAPNARVDAVAELLAVDTWSTATAEALRRAGGDPTLLVTLALVSPEYVSN